LALSNFLAAFLEPLGDMNRPDRFPIPVPPVVGGDIASDKDRIVSPDFMDHLPRAKPAWQGERLPRRAGKYMQCRIMLKSNMTSA
jgi:hypothetical protein